MVLVHWTLSRVSDERSADALIPRFFAPAEVFLRLSGANSTKEAEAYQAAGDVKAGTD